MVFRRRTWQGVALSLGRPFSEKGRFRDKQPPSSGSSTQAFGSFKVDKYGRGVPSKNKWDGLRDAHKPRVKPMPFNSTYDDSSFPSSSADVEPPLSREAVQALAERLTTPRRGAGSSASRNSQSSSVSSSSTNDTSISPFASDKMIDRFNKGVNRKVVLSDATYNAVLDYHVEKKWFAPIWFTLRRNNLTSKALYAKLKKWQLIQFIIALCTFGGSWLTYSTERDAFTKMPPEDRLLYAKVLLGMNAGEFFNMGLAILKKEDPTDSRPPHERASIVVKRIREMGLDKVDWDLQQRKVNSDLFDSHSGSAISSWVNKMFHAVFWTNMTIGGFLETGKAQTMYEKQLELASDTH